MIVGKDDYKSRVSNPKLKTREETEGIDIQGHQDTSGTYPQPNKQGANNNLSSGALGDSIPNLNVGGNGNTSVPKNTQGPAVYPYIQTTKTKSGHIIEYNDTPGNERILIMHKAGAGIEIQSDGTILISTPTNKYDIVNGSQTVIIEGATDLVYKGGVNMTVDGDFKLNVNGNYIEEVTGHKQIHTHGYSNEIVDGYKNFICQDKITVATSQDMYVSAGTGMNFFTTNYLLKASSLETKSVSYNVDSSVYNLHAPTMNLSGSQGVIGGTNIDFKGFTSYMSQSIKAGVNMEAPEFKGNLKGKADYCFNADYAGEAAVAAASGGASAKSVGTPVTTITPIYSPILKFATDSTNGGEAESGDGTYNNGMEHMLDCAPIKSNNELIEVQKYLGVDKLYTASGGAVKTIPTLEQAQYYKEKYPENTELHSALTEIYPSLG